MLNIHTGLRTLLLLVSAIVSLTLPPVARAAEKPNLPALLESGEIEYPRLSNIQDRVEVRPRKIVSPNADKPCLQNMVCKCSGYREANPPFHCTYEYCEGGTVAAGKTCAYDIYNFNYCYTYDNLDCECVGWGGYMC
jgi:hypothetical protein